MLRFEVYNEGVPAKNIDLSGACVFGQESIPVRADLAAANGVITCTKRVPGACGLSLLWRAGQAGRFLLPTTRLPERAKPYILNVELARAIVTRISQKREDWGLFDFAGAESLNREFDAVKKKFVEALSAIDDPAAASRLADEALENGVTLGEKIALFHADIFLDRRKSNAAAASRTGFGCVVDLMSQTQSYQDRLREAVDFASIPVPWKHTEPKERVHQYAQVDAWINWAARNKKAVHAGPLVSFEPANLPEWLYIWEHDYETLRDLIYEHIQRIVQRYERQVRLWKVVSGINAYNNFDLSFEQLMELTRMSCLLVKKIVPKATVVIELAMPFGEYYARNQRTIPPLLYADMAVQSGIKFDAFGIQLFMGVPVDGMYVRDLLQVSSLLDEFVSLSKPPAHHGLPGSLGRERRRLGRLGRPGPLSQGGALAYALVAAPPGRVAPGVLSHGLVQALRGVHLLARHGRLRGPLPAARRALQEQPRAQAGLQGIAELQGVPAGQRTRQEIAR